MTPNDASDTSCNDATQWSVGEVVEPDPHGPEPLLATVRDTRQLLRIGKTQVFQLAKAGVLERRRVGGSTRITMRSIRKLAGV